MQQSEQVNELAKAFSKAQKAFPAIDRGREVEVKTKTGGAYKFCYAEFSDIRAAVKDILSDNGLSVIQSTSATPSGGTILLTTLLHDSGQWIRGEMPVRLPEGETGPQAFGSALTYAKRYAYTSILGLATEDDDDGNTAEGNHVTRTNVPTPDPEALAEFKGLVAQAHAMTGLAEKDRAFINDLHEKIAKYGNKVNLPSPKQDEWLKRIVSGGKRPTPAPVTKAAVSAVMDAPPAGHPINDEIPF